MSLSLYISGYLALIIILFNALNYWLFLWIRKSSNRKRTIKLAKLARLTMKFHRKTAVAACVFVAVHGSAALIHYGLTVSHPVIVSGLISFVFFTALIISGIIRNRKATGRRKRSHRLMSFLFLLFVLGHILISVVG